MPYLTCEQVTGSPPCHFTPGLRVNFQTVLFSLARPVSVARSGTISSAPLPGSTGRWSACGWSAGARSSLFAAYCALRVQRVERRRQVDVERAALLGLGRPSRTRRPGRSRRRRRRLTRRQRQPSSGDGAADRRWRNGHNAAYAVAHARPRRAGRVSTLVCGPDTVRHQVSGWPSGGRHHTLGPAPRAALTGACTELHGQTLSHRSRVSGSGLRRGSPSRQILTNSSASRLAPPTSAPSMSGSAMMAAMLAAFTEPP